MKLVGRGRAQVGVAVGALPPNVGHDGVELFVGASAAHERPQVVTIRGKEAGVELSIRRYPYPCARAAERLGHAGDDPDLTTAVTVTPPHGSLALVIWRNFFERQFGINAVDHFGRRYDLVHSPTVTRSDIHVLDVAENVWRTLEVPRHRDDVLVVLPSLDHHVDLDRPDPDLVGGLDCVQYLGHRKVNIVHPAEGRIIERVQRDRHPI